MAGKRKNKEVSEVPNLRLGVSVENAVEKGIESLGSNRDSHGEFIAQVNLRERAIPIGLKMSDNIIALKARRSGAVGFVLKQLFDGNAPEELRKDEAFNDLLGSVIGSKLTSVKRKRAFRKLRRKLRHFDSMDGHYINEVIKRQLADNIRTDVTVAIFEQHTVENEQTVEFNKWYADMVLLDDAFVNGKITAEKYHSQSYVLYSYGVSRFGDEATKEVWDAHEEGEMDFEWSDEDEESEIQSEFAESMLEGIGLSDDELDEAVQEAEIAVDGSGVRIETSVTGVMNAVTSDGFSLPLTVRLHESSGRFMFYLKDDHAEDGIVGPLESNKIAEVLDRRNIDSFISEEFLENSGSDQQDVLSDVPDDDVIHLAKHVIDEGESRGFSLSDGQKLILTSLVNVLAAEDDEYSGLYYKIEALNAFAGDHKRAEFLRKKLRVGEKISVSKLIEEFDSMNG